MTLVKQTCSFEHADESMALAVLIERPELSLVIAKVRLTTRMEEPAMAKLIRSVHDEAPISYGRFYLHDGSGHGLDIVKETEHGALLAEPDGIALGQVALVSRARARLATVRMEAWDAEPGEGPGEPWAEAGRVLCLSVGGIVLLCGMGHGPTGQKLLLGPPHFAYWLSAYTGSVRSEPTPWGSGQTEAAEESWLLRFWPVADASGPALRGDVNGGDAARMREILSQDLGSAAPRPAAWPALRSHPQLETATAVMHVRLPDTGRAMVRYASKSGRARGAGRVVPSVDSGDDPRLVHETLGDLLHDTLGNLPRNVWSWSRSMLEDYATRLRVDRRIGRELNPDDVLTLVLEASGVRTPFFGIEPGISGRAWVWGADESDHADVLSVGRQAVARDRIHQKTLLTGVVTVLRKENDFVEVRAATPAEAARVLDVEQSRG
ncbi:hypothetical protein [Nonomuraea maritima]|uniref:hypothetical protein n=1 Tax=Nonomuraea maritima TaxID=683260 RepID=UPI00371A029B